MSIRKTHARRSQAKVIAPGDDDQDEEGSSSSSNSDSDEDAELERASSDDPNSSDDESVVAEKNRRHEQKVKKWKEEKRKARAKKKAAKAKKKKKSQKKGGNKSGVGEVDPDIGKAPWEAVFSWQEKEFSPRELLLYRPEEHDDVDNATRPKRKKSKSHNIVERGYEHELSRRDKNETKVEPGSMHLFTYTDKDGFVPEQLFAPATDSSTSIQHVGRALVALPKRNEKHGSDTKRKVEANAGANSANGDTSGDPVTARLRRENNCKTMYIMACVDVSKENLESEAPEFFEVPLCAIRYYEQGRLLEVTPPFARSVHMKNGTTQHPSQVDLQSENKHTLPASMLGTYRFSTASGTQYEYTLSNASEVVNREIADELRKVEIADVEREINELSNMIGNRFERGAEADNQLRLFAYCEIVSAQRFDSDNLYVQYQLALPVQGDWLWPPEWDKYEIERRRSGSTQISAVGFEENLSDASGKDGVSVVYPVAHFAYPFELQCIHTEKKVSDGKADC